MTVPGRATGTVGQFQDHLRHVPYSERGTDGEGGVAAELLRFAPSGDAQEFTGLAGRYGFAGLGGRLSPPDNVLPFRRTRSR